MIPDLPSVLYAKIDEYVGRFGHSMENWLKEHHEKIFSFRYDHQNLVLELFEDFVCDYNGTIHYTRTAERMMQCDWFDVHQKFLIACTYCFEDDIRRIWPYKNYSQNPQFWYWMCHLENLSLVDDALEEAMFDESMSRSRPSLEYSWNLLPTENRLQKAVDLFYRDLRSFVEYILPKLDHEELDEFLNQEGFELMYTLLKNSCHSEEFVLCTWEYVGNLMNESTFTSLIVKVLRSEAVNFCWYSKWDKYHGLLLNAYLKYCRDLDDFLRLGFEIWNRASENLKRAVVEEISLNERWLEETNLDILSPPPSREYKFLSVILSYATNAERNAFWHNCWSYLVEKSRWEDFHKIMKLCLESEDEIVQFKINTMANSETVFYCCRTLLKGACFDKMNDFASFLFAEIQTARNFKQELLQLALLDDNYGVHEILLNHEKFNEFINDAYNNNVDLSMDFKNQFISQGLIQVYLPREAVYIPIEKLNEFTKTFVSREETMLQIKTSIIDFLKETAAYYVSAARVSQSFLSELLSWCLGSDEEVEKFKLNYLPMISSVVEKNP